MTEDTPYLHGYAERGLVNAVFEAMGPYKNRDTLWLSLIKKGRHLPQKKGQKGKAFAGLKIAKKIENCVDIYVEPSLSDFGCPDVIVFVKTSDKAEVAFFVEAKNGSFLQSIEEGKKTLHENSSSILHELFLKARFYTLARKQPEKLREGAKIYKDDDKKKKGGKKDGRKIGEDPLVLKLAYRLSQCQEAYFVALTGGLEVDTHEIFDALKEIDDENRFLASLGDPATGWVADTFHLTWDDVWKWSNEHNLDRVKETLNENLPKMDIGLSEDPSKHREIEQFFQDCGLKKSKKERKPKKGFKDHRTTMLKDGKALLWYGIYRGIGGNPLVLVHHRKHERKQWLRGDQIKALLDKKKTTIRDLLALTPRLQWSGAAKQEPTENGDA
jgi:hypothetical protein